MSNKIVNSDDLDEIVQADTARIGDLDNSLLNPEELGGQLATPTGILDYAVPVADL